MDLGLKKIITNLVKDPTKLISIAEAWMISANPTPPQKVLAEARWKVCIGCDEFREHRDITGEPYCYECKCPLNKKIFSSKFNECPLNKWEDVDTLFLSATKKNKKTLL